MSLYTHTHAHTHLQSHPESVSGQTAELGALSDWLLGTCPSSSGSIIYQTSKNPEDWLLSHAESKVRP